MSFFLTAVVTISACSKDNTGEASPVSVGVEAQGHEVSGGGGDQIHLSPNEVEEFISKNHKVLVAEDYKVLKLSLFQVMDSLDRKMQLQKEESFERAFVTTYSDLLGISKEKWRKIFRPMDKDLRLKAFLNLPRWKEVEDYLNSLNSDNDRGLYFKDCEKYFPGYKEEHKASYSRENHSLCFDVKRIKIDRVNRYQQWVSIYFHELTHMLVHKFDLKLSVKAEEEVSRSTQLSINLFYSGVSSIRSNVNSSFKNSILQNLRSIAFYANAVCGSDTHYNFVKGQIMSFHFMMEFRAWSLETLFDSKVFGIHESLKDYAEKYFNLFTSDRKSRQGIDARQYLSKGRCSVRSWSNELAEDTSDLKELVDQL
mgnify:CR=1 FL=1